MSRMVITKVGTIQDGWLPVGFEFEGVPQDSLYQEELTSVSITPHLQKFSTEVCVAGWKFPELVNYYYWSIGLKGRNGVDFKTLDYLK